MRSFPRSGQFVRTTGWRRGCGGWSVSIAGDAITGGRYRLARVEQRVEVELDVTEHWKPRNLPLGMNILTHLMHMFRAQPASYRQRGTVVLDDSPKLSGAWQRKEKVQELADQKNTLTLRKRSTT